MNKKLCSVAAAVAAGVLLVSGTFAWTNFNSSAINSFIGRGTGQVTPGRAPGGTLHNDFEEGRVYRDVYVENWGTEPLIVRLQLTEYMEIGEGAGSRNSAENNAVSLVEDASLNDVNSWTRFSGLNESGASDVFRHYWNWTMGGMKYYFPAPHDLRGTQDENGIDFVSTRSPVGSVGYRPDYANVRQTLNSQVLPMDEWVSRGMPIGHYWVVDTDGFSYWAAPLAPNEATGLLLHKVEMVNATKLNYFYAINVVAHMATIDDVPDNYQRLLTNASPEGAILVNKIADRIRNQEQQGQFELMNTWLSGAWLGWEGAALFQSKSDVLNFVNEQQNYFMQIPEPSEFLLDINEAYFNDRAVLFVSANQFSGSVQADFRGVRLLEGVLEVNLHSIVPSGDLADNLSANIFAISIDRSLVSENIHVNHTREWPYDHFDVIYRRADRNPNDTWLAPVAFQSRRELHDFYTNYENQGWLEEHTVELLQGLDDTFFNNRAVILASASVTGHREVCFHSLFLEADALTVSFTIRPSTNINTAHNSYNHIFIISVDRSFYRDTVYVAHRLPQY